MENYQSYNVPQKFDIGIYDNSLMTSAINSGSGPALGETCINMFTQQTLTLGQETSNLGNVEQYPSNHDTLPGNYMPLASHHGMFDTCENQEGITSLPVSDLYDDLCSKTKQIEQLCDDTSIDIGQKEIETVLEPVTHKLLVGKDLQSRENTMSEKHASVESVLELFPFICGICGKKFNQVPDYFSHIDTHESVSNLFHCCDRGEGRLSELYTCGICHLKFPSLCTVYRHVVVDEKLNDFVYKSCDNTIYAFVPDDRGSVEVLSGDKDEQLDDTEHESKTDIFVEKDSDSSESCFIKAKKKRKKDPEVSGRVDVRQEPDYKNDEGVNFDHDNSHRSKSRTVEPFIDSTEPKRPTNMKNVLFPCEICGGFYQYQNLKKHKTIHAERNHACDQCANVYKSQFRLNAHKRQVHAEEKKFTCDECGKSFKASQYLRQHRQVHVKECTIQCLQCPMKFRYKALLKTHMLTHSEDKPFQCDQCERAFKQSHQLKFHKNSFHRDERTFACTECNKMFKTSKDIRQHHWVHRPPRYFCPVCDKSFIQKANMRLHVKIHGIQV